MTFTIDETPEELQDPRRISNSEVGTWTTCKRKYYFAFDLKLEKIERGEALSRGVIGHEVLESYYGILAEGHSHEDAKHIAATKLTEIMTRPGSDMKLCLSLKTLLDRYWDYYQGHPDWEILEVESSYDLPMTNDFTMPMRLDLLIRIKSTGKIYILDHKFCYDFWSYHQIALSPQFAKYVAGLRYDGKQIDGCILNQIRYRSMKDQDPAKYFKQEVVVPSNAKIRNVVREHIVVSQEIVEHRSKPPGIREALSVHVLNTMICKGCDFKDICASELDGGETEFLIQNEYQTNTYDYNKVVALQEGLL